VVIGRNEPDNLALEEAVRPGDAQLRWADGSSPMGVVTGTIEPELLESAAKILLRYTKARLGATCAISVVRDGKETMLSVVHEFDEGRVEEFRV